MLHILHLEDNADDAFLIQQTLLDHKIDAEIQQVPTRAAFLDALERGGFDLILADSYLPGLDGAEAMKMARAKYPEVSMIAVSGAVNEVHAQAVMDVARRVA